MMTPIRALVLDVLRQVTKTVEQDCSDEQLASAIQIVMPSVAFGGGINPCDYCNADKAMDILHLGKNRRRFFDLLKVYKVKNNKINNQPIGYKLSDIYRIARYILPDKAKKAKDNNGSDKSKRQPHARASG